MGTKVDYRTISGEALEAIKQVNMAQVHNVARSPAKVVRALEVYDETARRRASGEREQTQEENFRDSGGTFRRRV